MLIITIVMYLCHTYWLPGVEEVKFGLYAPHKKINICPSLNQTQDISISNYFHK